MRTEVRCTGPTGVEMEALTAAAVASLAIYDMCKGLHRGIRIAALQLVHKSGGRSGTWERQQPQDSGSASGQEALGPARPVAGPVQEPDSGETLP